MDSLHVFHYSMALVNHESLYLRLPVFMQNWVCSLEGRRIQRTRFGPGFWKALQEAERRGSWSNEQILAYRDQRLCNFIKHCATSVPYYQRLFQREKIDPQDIRGLADMAKLPVLNKAEIQEQYPEFLSTLIDPKDRITAHTSGTTGGGLRFATTVDCMHQQWAVWWRYRHWHGIPFDTWCGYFGGRSVVPVTQNKPPFWRYNRPGRQILFSGYHMSSDTLGCYVDELRRTQPAWLHGYPSLLTLIAAFLLDHSQTLGYSLQWITIGAENLLEQQVALMREAFGVTPIQHYGMAEGIANFSQCPHGRMHVDEDFAATEFLPLENGQGYKVIGSNFTNLATPLLRYDVGDIVEIADTPCACQRPGRIVYSVDGRKEDYIILRNGVRLGRLDHIFKDLTAIREAQIFQDTPGIIRLRVVRRPSYTRKDEALLLTEFRKRIGDQADVSIDYVAQLPRSSSGKLRFVVSSLGITQRPLTSRATHTI